MEKKDSFQFLKALANKHRVGQSKERADEGVAFLGVVLDQRDYYIPVAQIRELIPDPNITPVGHTKPWLKGLLKVQGEIYSVIDMALLLGLSETQNKHALAIALSAPEGNYAILVSSVLGLRKALNLQPMNADDYTVTFQTADKEEILALSVPSIIESKELVNMSIF